jgi:mRNA interferase MazF
MIEAGQIVIFHLPHTDMQEGKSRPVLLIAKAPGRFNDWLACAISTQLNQAQEDFDEILSSENQDFDQSGLKADSVIRIAKLGVLDGDIFQGAIGTITPDRLKQIKARLIKWIET